MREDGGGASDPKFLRSFNDWEMEGVQEFIGVTSNIKISPLEKDKLFWKGNESRSFKVKADFKELEGVSHIKCHAKCYGTSISLLKWAFLHGRCGGVRFLPQLS